LHKIIDKNEKIYWICPLIEENQEEDQPLRALKAAIVRYNELRSIFGDKVGLIHGKMLEEEKNLAMQNFLTGIYQILVATTVIEVGIDVKDATIIIIEHAERFGLSQLHQLRGRVGRSNMQSYCILLYYQMNEYAKSRLNIIKSSDDGFIIAEEDLKLRGAGDLLGTKQSGIKDFKFADISQHQDLLIRARQVSQEIIQQDPQLLADKNQSLKNLLYLFDYHRCLQYLKSG